MKIYDFEGRKNICGTRIREERLKRNMRQEDLAIQLQLRSIGIDRRSITRIEGGLRFVADYEVRAIADVFGMTTDELLGK